MATAYVPKSLNKWILSLTGEAFNYANDYLDWWIDGGREPNVDRYIYADIEDTRIESPTLNAGRAREIAAKIRATVKG